MKELIETIGSLQLYRVRSGFEIRKNGRFKKSAYNEEHARKIIEELAAQELDNSLCYFDAGGTFSKKLGLTTEK